MLGSLQLENFNLLPLTLVPFVLFFALRYYQNVLINRFNKTFTNNHFKTFANDFFIALQKSPTRIRLVSLGLLFLCAALLQPKWGYKTAETTRKGTDLVIAVDVSDSMLADDVSPNRLTRAKREIIDLIDHLKGDRIGLVSFSGSAMPEVPLTLDYEAYKSYLEILDPELSPIKGSNIAAALLTSFEMLTNAGTQKSGYKDKAVILVTDGEDFTGNFSQVKEEALKKGIGIFVVGIGTEKGAPLRSNLGYKRDKSGNIIISKLQTTALKELAEKTGGNYVTSVTYDSDTVTIYNKGIRQKLRTREFAKKDSKLWNQYFQIPLLIGIILIFRAWNGAWFLVFMMLYLCTPKNALAEQNSNKQNKAVDLYAKGDFQKSEESFNSLQKNFDTFTGIAANKYRQGEFLAAFENFIEASKSAQNKKLKAESYYNAGNSLTQLEKYKEAISLFQESLKLNPNDSETKENLEYVKKIIQEQQKPQQEQNKQSSSSSSSSSSNSSSSSSSESSSSSSSTNSSNSSSSSSNNSSDSSSSSSGENSSDQKSSDQSSSSSQSSENKSSEQSSSKGDSSESSAQSSSEGSSAVSSNGKEDQATSSGTEEGKEQALSQLYNVEETLVPNYNYRLKKSVEQLKKLKLQKPENDW